MRGFEKISFKQFKKDISDNIIKYEEYKLPCRSTQKSAGYDLFLIDDIELLPGEIKKIPTGIKVYMEDDEALFLIVRSSVGFKYNVRLTNQVGVIDADYYNNISNEGHMYISVQNEGKASFSLKKGDRIVQGIFTKYLKVDNEVDVNESRVGWTVLNKGE
ncbi:MAG: dUTP diphosphatase [Bacilli bacterium]